MTFWNYFCFSFLLLVQCMVQSDEKREDYIRITQQPRMLLPNTLVHIVYKCSHLSVIHVQLAITTDFANDVIFKKKSICDVLNTTKAEVITIGVPRYLVYRPGSFNKYSIFVLYSTLQTWMHPISEFINFEDSSAREAIRINVLNPFDRPQRPLSMCLSWIVDVLNKSNIYAPICPLDLDIIHVLSKPMVLTGSSVGYITTFEPYKNVVLENYRIKNINQPRFTFSMMIYVIEYCDRRFKYCSLMHHYTWDDHVLTPLVLITHSGQIHLELFLLNDEIKAYLSSDDVIIPKRKWVQVVITCHSSHKWELHLRYDKDNYNSTKIILKRSDVIPFDDTKGVFAFGGSDLRTSFYGFIGNIVYFRNKAMDPANIEFLLNSDLLSLTNNLNCAGETDEIEAYNQKINSAFQSILIRASCPSYLYKMLRWKRTAKRILNVCTLNQNVGHIKQELRRSILHYDKSNELLAASFYKRSLSLLETDGHKSIEDINVLLKHSSCLLNTDAMYLRSIFMNHGIGMPSNSQNAYNVLMRCAILRNRFCLMSLAFKHTYGQDSVPININLAYAYFMDVAYTTKKDLDEHRNEDVYTELIRLNDERMMERQTDEDDNLFLWLKHQASQGIVSAQQNLAQMLYWGSRGIKRNISTASNYYKAAAESKNPTALYDYAIILLKGHGVERDVAKSMELLEEAAKQNHANAINTIGWYALTQERNMLKAAEYLERSFQLGNADAGHNLAYMLLTGKYPGIGRDKVKAWRYIARAAARGNYDSAVLVALYNMKGHPSVSRSNYVAMEWGRYMAEQNPSIGKLLMKGIKNFRLKNWYSSLMYYLMAAEAGVEVANFNVAYLCDENYDFLSSVMKIDCVWRHYNQSIQRTNKRENPYAWMRIADLQYNSNDIKSASLLYCEAAMAGDPQGLFNLALAVQSNLPVPDIIWQKLNMPFNLTRNRQQLLIELYTRCMKSSRDDSYIPCLVSLTWAKIKFFFSKFSALIIIATSLLSLVAIYMLSRFRSKIREQSHDHVS